MPAKMPTVEFIATPDSVSEAPFEAPAKIMARRYAAIGQKAKDASAAAPAVKAGEGDVAGATKSDPEKPADGNPSPAPVEPVSAPADKPQPDPEDKGEPKTAEEQTAKGDDAKPPAKEEPAAKPNDGQDKNLAKAWASVMRKDKEVQKALAEVREYQKDQAGYNEYRQNKDSFERFKQAQALITTDPDEALRLLGAKGGYNEISERMLERMSKGEVKNPQERLIETLVSKIDGLEKRLEESGKTSKEREKEEARVTVENYIGQLDKYLRSKPDDFALSIANNAAGLVFDTMREYHSHHGKYLSEQEAAELVENHFRKQARDLVSQPTIRKALGLEAAPEPKKDPAPQPDHKNGSKANDEPPKTLTNSMPTGGLPAVERNYTLSREEQIRRLVARKYGGSQTV